MYRAMGLSANTYKHGFQRGVYFAPLYENTPEFLREEITKEQLIPSNKLRNDVDDVMGWWTPKAIRRYENLHKDNRINSERLYYRKLVQMSWDDVKKKYLKNVGR